MADQNAKDQRQGSGIDIKMRTVRWDDPAQIRAKTEGMNGLEVMRAIRDGSLGPPPMASLMGFRCTIAEPGHVVMELVPEPSLENSTGTLHGAVAMAMLDTAMGAAAQTLLPLGQGAVTHDMNLTYLKPLSMRSGTVRAEGRLVNHGRILAYAEGHVYDGSGKLAVQATASFAIVGR